MLGVDAVRRVASVAGRQIEESQTGSPLFELVVDEQIALDVAVGSVRCRGVDPELRATVHWARKDVVVPRPPPGVLLPGDPAASPDRLVLAHARTPENDLRGGGAHGRRGRHEGREGNCESRQY